MKRLLRRIAAACGRPLLVPLRSQIYAWIDYRIAEGPARAVRMRAHAPDGNLREVTFEDTVPALLAAISSSNAAAREARRREVALTERVDALEAELRAMRGGVAKWAGRDDGGLRAA